MTRTRITTDGITDASVTYAKVQNVAADRLLGRSAGAGTVQEIVCTPAGRALIDDADAAAQRTTLGLGSLIDVGGNVGIGTASPTAIVTIGGAGDQLINRSLNDGSVGLIGGASFTGATPAGSIFLRGATSSYNPGGIELITGAAERVRVTSTGNVGIGTASPAANLEVAASAPQVRVSSTGGATGQLLSDGSSFYVGPTGSHSLRLQTNGTTRAIIDSSGNVGLGTASPAVNLHVVDAAAPDIRVSGAGPSLDVFTDTTTGYVGTTSNHNLVMRTNNVDRWRMGTDGSLQTTAVGDTNNTLRPAGHIRAWARFNGGAASPITPVRSFNVTSITKNGTGSWTLNLQTPLSSDNGVAVASGTDTTAITALSQVNNMSQAVVASSTAVRVTLVDTSNVFIDAANISVIVCDL